MESGPIPGSYFMRFIAWIWYTGVMSLYLGPLPMIRELRHKIKRVDYATVSPRRSRETVVLTGGTRGIGREVLKRLLQLDFTVVMGARSKEAGLKVVKNLRESGVNCGQIKCFALDLKSLKSVQSFGKVVLENCDRIDLLINNAGIMFEPWELTEDNIEAQFQVNYLSHQLLSQLLLPKMKETGAGRETACRIVNVSSLAHYAAFGNYLEDCANPKIYSSRKAYFESKLCQVISTKQLNKRLQEEKANVIVFAVHPGVIPTDLYNSLGLLAKAFKMMKSKFRSIEEGAQEIMFAATSPKLEKNGGNYIQNTEVTASNSVADKSQVQKLLWDITQDKLSAFLQ